jgi:hypothetical protein
MASSESFGKKLFSFLWKLLFIIFLPHLGMSIASFIVARNNMDYTCANFTTDNSTLVNDTDTNTTSNAYTPVVRLNNWLIVYASVSSGLCALSVIYIIQTIGWILCGSKLTDFIRHDIKIFYLGLSLFSAFNVAWNIVGAVSLFRDSTGCKNEPIWSMTLACLILQWVGIALAWYTAHDSPLGKGK